MGSLSWLFFCLSPFALFCSSNGNGLILCPLFIILGFIFRRVELKKSHPSQIVIEVEPQKFWEWHYKDRIKTTLAKKDSIHDKLMVLKDKEAREWATTICGYHNAWVPPEAVQEQIARENGVVTEKIVKENIIKKDRIQIGKHFLMRELGQKYNSAHTLHERKEIERAMCKIRISGRLGAGDIYVKQEYGMTVNEMWELLTQEEKQKAKAWVKEYEERLIKVVQDYKVNQVVRHVEMDF